MLIFSMELEKEQEGREMHDLLGKSAPPTENELQTQSVRAT